MPNKLLSFIAALFLLNGFAFAGAKEAYQEYEKGKAVFIDVRENEEVKEGMIKGAFWIPLSVLQSTPDTTINKVRNTAGGKHIYIYCRSGRRSQVFIDGIKSSGIEAVNLGGYPELVSEGLPVSK